MGRKAMLWMLVAAAFCCRAEVVPIADTPMPAFTLPDGTVLTNAYAWRRSSEGIMIVHDGGSYFLNFALLPPDWKAVYAPAAADAPAPKPADTYDKYQAGMALRKIPGLSPDVCDYLLWNRHHDALDPEILGAAALQSTLEGNTKEAGRLIARLQEEFPSNDVINVEELLLPCAACGGTGTIVKECTMCGGTGKCPRCDGEGTRPSELGGNERIRFRCTLCNGTGRCVQCQGKGKVAVFCSECGGRGKLVDKEYAKTQLDRLAQRLHEGYAKSAAGP